MPPNESLSLVAGWLEDETLYSWAARHHLLTGAISAKATGVRLFGAPQACREIEAPSGLPHFCRATLGRLGTLRELLLQRTVLAAYFPFWSIDQYRHFDVRSQCQETTAWISAFGMRASSSEARCLRCCQACTHDDLQRFGVSRWRLPHQLPGAWICLDHDCLLSELRPARGVWHTPPKSTDVTVAAPAQGTAKALRMLAALSGSLKRAQPLNLHAMRRVVLAGLRDRHVIGGGHSICAHALQTWFEGSNIAHWLRSSPPRSMAATELGDNWVHHTLRSRRISHPLRWLLLWTATFSDLEVEDAVKRFHEPLHVLNIDDQGQRLLWVGESFRSDPRVLRLVTTAPTLKDAARELGVSVTALRDHLRTSGCLTAEVRLRDRQSVRKQAAIREIEERMREVPACTRSDIHHDCRAAVAWLSKSCPETLSQLLAKAPDKRRRQADLFDVK